MDPSEGRKRRGGVMKFFGEYWALFIKMLLLTKRKRSQTIVEFLLAYVFICLLLGMRYLFDRSYYPARTIPPFRPFDLTTTNSTTANKTYYYPGNPCTAAIVNNAMNNLAANVPGFSVDVSVIPSSNISALPNTTVFSIYAYIYFTNIDAACSSASSIPDQVHYTLRMQENGLNYYRAQDVMISTADLYWKRAPEAYCQDNTTTVNYTTQFLGVQYFVDLAIIQYVTSANISASSVYLNHFGCPASNQDQLHSDFRFFVPLFFALIYIVTFLLNLGYIVEERANKTKEYLRIFGLRTWVNNLVWITRSMIIYCILTSVCTGLCYVGIKSSGSTAYSLSRAIFNYTNWTLLWTILFVYAIEVSAFAVFFGQFFKRALLAKLLGFVIWIITFIDFYSSASVGVRYFLCFFPNAGLLFCLQVLEQYERRGVETASFSQLYSNIFDYPLYIGICLLMQLIYSVLYLFLAVYVERINPGEFGIAQPWYYLFKKSYWTSSVQPTDIDDRLYKIPHGNGAPINNHWIEMNTNIRKKNPTMSIEHLNKKFGKFQAVTDLSLEFFEGEVYTLLGHNGAGKTTTTFILVGMLEPTSGRVMIQGLDNQLQIEEVRHNMGFCPQYDILYDDLSVEEHLELIAKMRHMDKRAMKQSIETILHLISLTNDRGTLSKDLSGGMKRRLSIGISLINDPKVVILDEPTSGIDPYNRRLIWTIIRKLKSTGKCVLLTTHFLEEADVLSDRIAIMSRGRLQANGTPDFLKQQTEFEYRLSMDRNDQSGTDRITQFIQAYIPNIVLERQSAAELVYGIRRADESKQVERLIDALDREKNTIGINSYGLSMTTIEDVFLRLVQEEEENEKIKNELDDRIFRKQYQRVYGASLFWTRLKALFIKRWHVSRRQLSLFFGFFFLAILIEILTVAVLPTPNEIQATLTSNTRVVDAQVTLIPSIYNPQTIVAYANNDGNLVKTRLLNYLINTNASVVPITTDTVLNYVQSRYYQSESIFINTYQLGFAGYDNGSATSPAMAMSAYFSTMNYHSMPTSLGVAATNLFQFYANSSSKSIITTNQPLITNPPSASFIAQALTVLSCFETFPVSLFSFINSIIAVIFIGILLLTIITERVNRSKDLQLLTNVSKRTYWLANWLYDFLLCLVLIGLLVIIVKIGASANPKTDAEVHAFTASAATGYLFVMYLMYILASLPFVYVFSFISKSSIMGFTNFFILNIIILVIDAISASFPVFTGNDNSSAGVTKTYQMVSTLRALFGFLLPAINLRHAIGNILLHDDAHCIGVSNSLLGTSFQVNTPWMSTSKPGVGTEFILFCVQIFLWLVILAIVEGRSSIRQAFRRCCGSEHTEILGQWGDSHLDEDVRRERRMVLQDTRIAQSSVILVQDLVKTFEKRKSKLSRERTYVAVDHLNFNVEKSACFGLLGANGAGKTTTFSMLINDIQPSSGQIIINGKNINQLKRDLEVGFCPQFDWLVYDLSVSETLTLFARLKGVHASEITDMCNNITKIFGLETYEKRTVQKLSGGNKRKVGAALAFMANPALVFLDEPTTGLDAAAKRKLWKVIRAARDVGLTIIMTSHSMEECEALCTKIGIMKTGQFVCLGNLQHLRNRFGSGYAVRVKVAGNDVERVKGDLMMNLPGIEIQDQHNEVLFCNVPFSAITSNGRINQSQARFNLSRVFEVLNARKEQQMIESYSVTQTTLEQIFVQLAGEDEYEPNETNEQSVQPITTSF